MMCKFFGTNVIFSSLNNCTKYTDTEEILFHLVGEKKPYYDLCITYEYHENDLEF